jgi:Galactose oxidase, central domain
MAKALPAGRPIRRRPMFGLFDADGWGWATTKAFFWLLVLIIALGYIPDRAYYFVVSRTIDLGILAWSPVNLCPPENGQGMPCPVPAGGIVPWQASPQEAALPQPRTQGSATQLGTNVLYIGGSDGSAPTATTYLAQVEGGSFTAWTEGPALPEARTNAGLAILSGTAYLVGGEGPDGEPTDTVWSIGLDPDTSALGEWTELEDATLPEARQGAAVVAVSDGIVVVGGAGPDGAPTGTVWKSTIDSEGALGEFQEQPGLAVPVTDASAALEGTFLWVYGGSAAEGPTDAVQRADYGVASTVTGSPDPAQPSAAATAGEPAPSPGASGAEGVVRWVVDEGNKLPEPRTGAAGFAANGALYLVGGYDGNSARSELYWALPNANGNLPNSWRRIDRTDLPEPVVDAAPLLSGSNVAVVGGSNSSGQPLTTSYRASLAPEEPFFQLGILGVVVPALQIGGEIGQQLGYLAAAGVGTGNFVILVVIGYLLNHKPQLRSWWERRKAAREARAT